MSWISRVVVCVLAILFAASGVRKATGRDAGPWQVAHGVARVAFGSFVVVGTVWSAVRRRETAPEPSDPGPPPAADRGPASDDERPAAPGPG